MEKWHGVLPCVELDFGTLYVLLQSPANLASLVATLKENGFYVITTSHREKGTLDVTVRWLDANKLVFDEMHLSYDRTAPFIS